MFIEWILEADTQAFLFFNSLYLTGLDNFVLLLTAEWTWIPLYAYLLWLACQRLQRQVRKCLIFGFAIALVIGLADQTTSRLMKPYFQRLRPSHEPALASQIHLAEREAGKPYRGGKFGFASSHAANTFGLAFFMLCLLGRQGRWLFLWAGIVSYTRIYLGVHYPLDILFGAFVGMAWAWIVWRIVSPKLQS